MRKHLLTTTAAMLLAMTGSAFAGMDEAKQFLDKEVGRVTSFQKIFSISCIQQNITSITYKQEFLNIIVVVTDFVPLVSKGIFIINWYYFNFFVFTHY